MKKTRGYAKKGTYNEKTKLDISISVGVLEKINKIAEKNGLSRSNIVENFIEIALFDYELLDRLGLITIGRAVRDFLDKGFEIDIKDKQRKIII